MDDLPGQVDAPASSLFVDLMEIAVIRRTVLVSLLVVAIFLLRKIHTDITLLRVSMQTQRRFRQMDLEQKERDAQAGSARTHTPEVTSDLKDGVEDVQTVNGFDVTLDMEECDSQVDVIDCLVRGTIYIYLQIYT